MFMFIHKTVIQYLATADIDTLKEKCKNYTTVPRWSACHGDWGMPQIWNTTTCVTVFVKKVM